jgi:hypothetical protein
MIQLVRNAPSELYYLNHEIENIRLILDETKSIINDNSRGNDLIIDQNFRTKLEALLEQPTSAMESLKAELGSLSQNPKWAKSPIKRCYWLRTRVKHRDILKDISDSRRLLYEFLNVYHM